MWTTRIRAELIASSYAGRLPRGSRVLDVGCGDGVVSKVLADRFGLDLIGTDLVDCRRADIRFAPLGPRGEFPPPPAGRRFDAVLFNDALHHMTDQRQAIDRALEAADLVLAFEVGPGPLISVFDKLINLAHRRGMPTPLAFRSPADWLRLLAGRDVEVAPAASPPRWYPFSHFVISVRHAQKSPADQPADR